MTRRYLSRSQFAERIGVKTATLSRYDLPEPDVIIGSAKWPTFGWTEETIDAWNAARPGRGRRKRRPGGNERAG
ncbi:MAG: helix-turn-helix transcriptional regulator [Rhodobacterales bacterium]|nr:helix-turn-helix transcriptional regulator [Rhodobacterales bacterium]